MLAGACGRRRTGRRMFSTTEVYCSSLMKPVSGEKALHRAPHSRLRPRAPLEPTAHAAQ